MIYTDKFDNVYNTKKITCIQGHRKIRYISSKSSGVFSTALNELKFKLQIKLK